MVCGIGLEQLLQRVLVGLPRALELCASSQRTHDVYNIREWVAPLAMSTLSQQDDGSIQVFELNRFFSLRSDVKLSYQEQSYSHTSHCS